MRRSCCEMARIGRGGSRLGDPFWRGRRGRAEALHDKWCSKVHLRFFVGGAEGDAFGTIVYNGRDRPPTTLARRSNTSSRAGLPKR